MEIRLGDIYRIDDGDVVSAVVKVEEINSGSVKCVPLSGGWSMTVPFIEFQEKFVRVSRAAPASSPPKQEQEIYRLKHYDFDHWEQTIPGWSNGKLWKGWGCPHFELETLRKAVETGVLGNEAYAKVIILADVAITIKALTGTIPKKHDWSPIVARLRANKIVTDYRIAPDTTIEAELFHKKVIKVDGQAIETIPLGVRSWCWREHAKPHSAHLQKA